MKKVFLLAAALSICIMFTVTVNPVNAALNWYEDCSIGGAGAQGGTGLVYISEGGPGGLRVGWYALGRNATEANQGIAAALTAVSTGGKVTVLVDPDDGRFWSLILGILTKPVQ